MTTPDANVTPAEAPKGPAVKFLKIHPEATLPRRAHPTDTGLDLFSCRSMALAPGAFHVFETGFKIELPDGFEGQVRPRSGLAAKHGVTVLNAPGSVDSSYRGALNVILINHGPGTVDIKAGDRIAQLVIAPVTIMPAELVEELSDTDRGVNGFGSTGA